MGPSRSRWDDLCPGVRQASEGRGRPMLPRSAGQAAGELVGDPGVGHHVLVLEEPEGDRGDIPGVLDDELGRIGLIEDGLDLVAFQGETREAPADRVVVGLEEGEDEVGQERAEDAPLVVRELRPEEAEELREVSARAAPRPPRGRRRSPGLR